jgi:hypothetical protein
MTPRRIRVLTRNRDQAAIVAASKEKIRELSDSHMQSELVIRRTDNGHFDLFDTSDPNFELREITDTQLLGYLRNRKLVGITAEAVLASFDIDAKRSSVRVVIDRSL